MLVSVEYPIEVRAFIVINVSRHPAERLRIDLNSTDAFTFYLHLDLKFENYSNLLFRELTLSFPVLFSTPNPFCIERYY